MTKKKTASRLVDFQQLTPLTARSNTAPTLAAQSAVLCSPDTATEALQKSVESRIVLNTDLPVMLRAVCELLLMTGCRISQALNVKPSNISKNGTIKIEAAKGGNENIYRSTRFSNFWLDYRISRDLISNNYNRFFFYRLFIRYNCVLHTPLHSNKKVCHALRYCITADVAALTSNKATIKNILGHKSEKTQDYYVNYSKQVNKI